LAAVAVTAGAFGAHALRSHLAPADLVTFETAARYQMYHALALVAVGLLVDRGAARAPLAGWLFLAGIALFCGSLYLLVLTGQRWLGAVTPFGGISFIAAWVVLALNGLTDRRAAD
jgi:uncharacterized membrane protein YgdD (TMEM256/DUF423 family)